MFAPHFSCWNPRSFLGKDGCASYGWHRQELKSKKAEESQSKAKLVPLSMWRKWRTSPSETDLLTWIQPTKHIFSGMSIISHLQVSCLSTWGWKSIESLNNSHPQDSELDVFFLGRFLLNPTDLDSMVISPGTGETMLSRSMFGNMSQ